MGTEREDVRVPRAVGAPLTPEEIAKANAVLQEVSAAVQANKAANTPTPVTPVAETTTEAPAVTTPAASGLDYLKQFTDEYAPTTLTPEEMERRKRAAYTIQGIGALGNAASAISNLIYAGKGAPSMEIPKNIDASASITQLEESEKAKRNEIYLRAKDRFKAQQDREVLNYKRQQDKAEREYKRQKDAQDFKMKAGEFQIKLNELELKRQEAVRKGDLDAARLLKEQALAVKAQQDALYAPQRHKAYIGAQNASANRSNAAATAEKGMQSIPYQGAEGLTTFKVKKDDWNNATLLGAFANALDLPITWDKPVSGSTSVADLAVLLNGGKLPDDQATGGYVTTPGGVKTYYTKEQLQMIIGKALSDPANAAKVQSLIDLYEGKKPEVIKYTGPKGGSNAEEEEIEYYD